MPLVTVALQVANPSKPEQAESLKFLIDSGAVFSVGPRNPGAARDYSCRGADFPRNLTGEPANGRPATQVPGKSGHRHSYLWRRR